MKAALLHHSGAGAKFWWRAVDQRPARPAPVAMGPATVPSRPTSRARRSRPLLASALVGALVFAAGSGFGRAAQIAEPLPQQLDRMLVAAGLGINEVSVSGYRYALDAEIFSALALDKAGSLVGFDVGAARRRIEALAWVETATVVRVLPDKLKIAIEERRPAALWQQAGRNSLVDAQGRVLAHLAGDTLPALPRIAGSGAPEAVAGLIKALAAYPEIGGLVERARRVGLRRWTLEMKDGVQVHLPGGEESAGLARLARYQHSAGTGAHGRHVIDLRLDGVVVVRAAPAEVSAGRQRTAME